MKIEPAAAVIGHVAVPGDKSISHRAVLVGALAEGETRVRGFGRAGDTQATVHAMRALGVEVDDISDDELLVHGVGLAASAPAPSTARTPARSCACSRASLAGREGRFELTGDASLSSRPMERIAEPLRRMGATHRDDGRARAARDRGHARCARSTTSCRSRARR